MIYDYLIVGAGLFGATFAQQALEAGKRVLVIDRRSHIAGNCYSEDVDGIEVHRYGPHLFHTSNERIWRYVNRFAAWNGYHHQVMANTGEGLLSLPISLHTLYALHGIRTPERARQYFERVRESQATGDNAEDWCLRTIGRELYELLIKGYTEKQWHRSPRDLPAPIVKRLPIRLDWNNRYFSDRYEGIPIGGYTKMVERMLEGADVVLGVDFLDHRADFSNMAHRVVYSGSPDALFDYDLGRLAYRSIRIETEVLDTPDFQGIGQMNFTSVDMPWTRIVEPKHFGAAKAPHTVICKEFSVDGADGEPYYPINDAANTALAAHYQERAAAEGYIVGGRLGKYQYLDMHQAIGQALSMAEKEFSI